MKIDFRDGLLFTSITLNFEGKEKVIDIENGSINGSIGLDLLMKSKAIIDLNTLEIHI
ncbi:hypothetical protein SAMN05660297_03016 [Natronincola peptidivorans]|uniref:Uncharacterized protein n=1 Tax=Natronincola peptidivorans TaxID=426128 RepID=A0A1I0G054_9FIRM|nr:hypothetical protein [Natronincola peptidivorans]SET64188.1 hypothetical protein SAMN05660297_03016 [Natronincola peptidivorans]